MAGGIDWFRWHHGSVTDPKFALVARKAGASLPDVLAVWAYLLERASSAQERGTFGDIDFEAWDCLFGFDDGVTARIFDALTGRSLISEGRVAAWEKRQPKREREDDSAADRKRAQRERDAANAATSEHVTPCHATSRQKTPREEERREEKRNTSSLRSEVARQRAPVRPDGVTDQVWADWLQLRKAKKAPVTETVIASATAEASKAGMGLDAFLRVWCARGSQGLQADWLKPHERAGPPAGRLDRQLETAALLTGARRPQPKPIEAIDVESRILTA